MHTGGLLHPTNWRPLIFSGLLICQKICDEKCLLNSDFVSIYPFFTVKEICKLEMKFLEIIE